MTGHKSLSEVARYTRQADQQRLARQAMTMQLGVAGGTKGVDGFVQPADPAGQNWY
jgi:hypothetical protein